ncbi:MAG: HAMP domain-containing sensor histidine kinase, partial [Planctomycetota bacterium]|nr:HAMP domain-containing sensor histidine kinase [Planctomycetota bacterium]
SGAWSLALCVPVALEGRTAGVCKAVLDMSGWIENVDRVVAGMGAVAILVRDDGKIIYRRDIEPLTKTMKLWGGQIADAKVSGWRIAGNDIQAFAPIKLPQKLGHLETEMPNWLLVLHLPEKQALGAVYQVSVVMLIVGLVVILLIFLGGLWLIDRSVTRRIRRMAQAARSVARGDLAHRIQPDWAGRRLLGRDEIDRLAADFNEMVDRVQQSHEALKSANELKMNFIRIAGHELRTPVSYILGVGKLLRYSTSPEKLLHALQTVSARAKRLDEIIKAMFKIMPDQRYSAELRYGAVNVSELMEEVYIDMFPFVERRSQRLIVNCPKNLPTIQADLEKLRDIIENLIMNAIKFTPDGADIEVTLGKRLGGYLSIAVRDRGPGVPEGDLPNIFEPFYGGGDVMKHSTGAVGYQKRGMGLGLTIVRHFVELHHGTVNVTTGPDGATFTVVIPVEPPPPESRPLKP